MDINSILPFLMSNGDGNNENISQIMQLMQNGQMDETALMSHLLKQNGTNPQAAQILSMANQMNNNKNKPQRPIGITPIQLFVADDIMGKIVKYFAQFKK